MMKALLLTVAALSSLLAFAGDPSAKLEPLDRELMRPPPFPKKWETNLTALTATAEKGNAGAQFDLGAHYIFAVGTTQNLVKAFHWLTNSASQGYPPAQYTLGKLYKHGVGVVSNQALADAWFQLGVQQNYVPSKHEAALTADRKGKRSEALKLLREAAEKGFPSSQYLMGCVTTNLVESYVWQSLAAEGGLENAGTKALELRQQLTKEQLSEADERIRKFKEQHLSEPTRTP